MSQINYAVSLHSRETVLLKDVSRCCCPGDCSLESGLHQACISHFSLGLCISVGSSYGQRPQIKCKEVKQQAQSMDVMCWKWHLDYKEYHNVNHLNIELNIDAGNFCQADLRAWVCESHLRQERQQVAFSDGWIIEVAVFKIFYCFIFFLSLFAALGPKIWSEVHWIKNKTRYIPQVILRALKKILLIMKFLFFELFSVLFRHNETGFTLEAGGGPLGTQSYLYSWIRVLQSFW